MAYNSGPGARHASKKRLRSHESDRNFLKLNDDCLLGIFQHLSQIDLCHVRNVCPRFAPLAETAFGILLRKNRAWKKLEKDRRRSDTRRIFYNFGHLFKMFRVVGEIDSDILQRLTQITSLILVNVTIDGKIARAIFSAEHLKILDLVDCKFISNVGSRNYSKRPRGEDASLIRLIFQQTVPPLDIFTRILTSNQHLRCLGIPITIQEDYVHRILTHASKLSELVIFANDSNSRQMHKLVSNLKSPKLLAFNGVTRIMNVAPLLQGIENTSFDISLLILSEFIIDEESITLISKMKNLQHVVLKGQFTHLGSEFVSLAASLPLLNNFTIAFKQCSIDYKCAGFTFNVVKDIVKAGKGLEVLKILSARNIHINEEGYADLVDIFQKNSRKKKLSIEFLGCKATTSLGVPVQRSDLKIKYGRDATCVCKA